MTFDKQITERQIGFVEDRIKIIGTKVSSYVFTQKSGACVTTATDSVSKCKSNLQVQKVLA